MAEPLEDFINNFFRIQQFNEQRRQFNSEMDLRQRATQDAEITQFQQLAQFVKNPGELGALATYFTMRNPEAGPAFQNLMVQLAPSVQAQTGALMGEGMAGLTPEARQNAGVATVLRQAAGTDPGTLATSQVQAGRKPEEILQGIRIGEDQAMGVTGLEKVREFNLSLAQQQREANMRAALGWAGVGLDRARLQQEGEFRTVQLAIQGGGYPLLMQDQLTQRRQELVRQRNGPLAPAARQAIDQQIAELDRRSSVWGTILQSANPIRGAEAGIGPTQITSLIEARARALSQYGNDRSSKAVRDQALQDYNSIQTLLNSVNAGGQLLQPQQGGFFQGWMNFGAH